MTTDRVQLGSTAITIPALGIGTWAWGQRFLWGYGVEYGDLELREAFNACVEEGLTFFDTAEVYGGGNSERLLGQWLPGAPEAVVATKFNPAHPLRYTRKALLGALHASLERLHLPRVDLYQIHVPYSLMPMRLWLQGLADAVEGGMARAAGVSNFSAQQMVVAHETLQKRGVALASNQVHYSLLHRTPELDGLLPICRDLNITVLAYMPLAHGLLTGKYTPEHPPTGLRGRLYRGHTLAKLEPLLAALRRIGAAHGGRTPAQVALNWTICKGTVPLAGVKTARHVRDNAAALGWRLTPDEVAELDALSLPLQGMMKVWW